KGGNANLGVWAESDDVFEWLDAFLTVDRLRELLPDTRGLEVERYRFPNLRAVNFVLKGFLGDGVAASLATDPQAKGLGEYLLAKTAPIPSIWLGR
ncbi:MAG: exopolyphosphatase, partial [Acidobacteriota bacterium]